MSFNEKTRTRNDKRHFTQTQTLAVQKQSSKGKIGFGEKTRSMVVGTSSSTNNLHANLRPKLQ
jgi:hypothetical protein